MGKKSAEDQPTRRRGKSLKSYAHQVFQESSIGIVSGIASAPSKRRKFFKAFVLIFCLSGFLYQTAEFLSVVFTYPTNVDIDIKRPTILTVPAYTFCNNNGIQRSLFCEKYPDYCAPANQTMCTQYGIHCGEDTPMVPKEEYYNAEKYLTADEIIQVSGDLDVLLVSYENHIIVNGMTENEESEDETEKPTGPFIRNRDDEDNSWMTCYSLNERVNSSLYPLTTEKNMFMKTPVNSFAFYVDEDELFIPGNWPGILFMMHSPFEAINPFQRGIYMKPGRTYTIHVSMEEEILLPKPYQTACTNYSAIWEANGRKGPRMQEMCRHKCLNEIALQCFNNCVIADFLYPMDARLCNADEIKGENCPDDTYQKFLACDTDCKDDCHRIKYQYTVQTRPTVISDVKLFPLEQMKKMIFIKVYLEDDEVIVLKHSPKYLVVEVFGTIGGFVGGWLGISLLDVTDLFEGFFRIIRYAFKR